MYIVTLSKWQTVEVETLNDASGAVTKYINAGDGKGSGQWYSQGQGRAGFVVDAITGERVARISYNGRIWTADGKTVIGDGAVFGVAQGAA